MGGAVIGEGIQSIFTTAGTIARLTSASLITSGVSAAAAAATGVAASGIGEAMAFDSRLAAKSGLQSAVKYLGYVSMGLMAVSIASGIRAGIGAGMVKRRGGGGRSRGGNRSRDSRGKRRYGRGRRGKRKYSSVWRGKRRDKRRCSSNEAKGFFRA